jgi:hypothetical protein
VDHVPWHDYPDYLLQIAYPICINMVLNRLDNDFYRHAEASAFRIQRLEMLQNMSNTFMVHRL